VPRIFGALADLARRPAARRIEARRRVDLKAARAALVADSEADDGSRALLGRVSLEVHHRDTMYEVGRGRHYLSAGLSALRAIGACEGAPDRPGSILDFGCGYGRVLRFLKAAHPEADLVAADVDGEATAFCARVFDARPLGSGHDFHALETADRFDLIWCGSLVTHLDEPCTGALLAFFARHLQTGGACVLSAHGSVTIDALRERTSLYGLDPADVDDVLRAFDRHGYGYADYPGSSGYGISVASPERLGDLATGCGLTRTAFLPRGWDDHHDVYAFRV